MNEGQAPNRTAPGTTTNGTTFARVVGQTYPGMMAATLSYAAGKELYDLAQAGTPATVHFKTDNNITQRIDYDVIAETPGGDPTRVLQVGAHIDGVAAGPGINDDGSGTAMNLAIANQILKLGIPLKYKIRFGWFSGEEQGLFGSTFAVNQLNTKQTQQTLGMLDYDMIASTNYIPFMYIPNPSETTLPQLQRDSEATMSNIHINYLQNGSASRRRTIRSTTAPTTRSGAPATCPPPASTPAPRRQDRRRSTWPSLSTAASSASRLTRATTSGATRCST